MKCEGTLVDFVVKFPYLGCMLAGSGLALADVLYRLAGANRTWITCEEYSATGRWSCIFD